MLATELRSEAKTPSAVAGDEKKRAMNGVKTCNSK
jgi:hypothetical protein